MNINIKAPINDLGYGNASRGIILALDQLKHNVTLFPIGNRIYPQGQNEADVFKKCIDNRPNFDYTAPSLQIWHQFDLAERIGNGLNCALSFFELDTLKPNEINHLNSLDIVWAPSEWARDVLIKSKINKNKIFTQPMGVNTKTFYKNTNTIKNDQSDNIYTFLTIGKIEYRKGHDILSRMFSKAFLGNPGVKLQVMWSNPFLDAKEAQEWENMYRSELGSQVEFLPHMPRDEQVAEIINNANCGIFPTRAEGFCFPLLQMMACGKPVITTNYSGHTSFCTPENSYLIDISEKEDAFDGRWFNGEGQWAKIGTDQEDAFIEKMRFCYENRPKNDAGIKTAQSLEWKNVAQNFVNHLTNHVVALY